MVYRLDKQTSRFASGPGFEIVKKIRWTFGGKTGFEAILKEMQENQNALNYVITAIKLCVESGSLTAEERPLAKKLYAAGGEGIRRADIMEDVVQGRLNCGSTSFHIGFE